MRRFGVVLLVTVCLGACTANRTPAASSSLPSSKAPRPSPTGTYDPGAPRGGGTYTTKDGRLRFRYPSPWFIVTSGEPARVNLQDYLLTGAEQSRREKAEDYSIHNGEGYISFFYQPATHTLSSIRRDACKVGNTTLRIRECKVIQLNGLKQLWVLSDSGDDSDCTCRSVYIIENGREYDLVGGGCLENYCHQTATILKQVDAIFRGVVVR